MMRQPVIEEVLLTEGQHRTLLAFRSLKEAERKKIAPQTCFSAMEIRETANSNVKETAKYRLVEYLIIIRSLCKLQLVEDCTVGYRLTDTGDRLQIQTRQMED